MAIGRLLSVVALAACCALPGYGDVYNQDFETDTTGSWNVSKGPATTDFAANLFFDYSTIGIPSAPGSGATTRGLKMTANLSAGVFGGGSVSPIGVNMGEQFTMTFNWWSNFNGPAPAGGNGSTNLSTFGVGTAGTTAQWAGGVHDSVWFGATGDGGSGNDYRVYSSVVAGGLQNTSGLYSDTSGVYTAGNVAGVSNNSHAYYASFGGIAAPAAQLSLFPQQTGSTAAGAPAFAWHTVVIQKTAANVTWTVDNKLLATTPLAGAPVIGGGNFFFGHSDINVGSSTDVNDAALLFTLIDNVQVSSVPEANAWMFGAVALVGGAGVWWRRRIAQ